MGQPSSSEPSGQSAYPSHTQVLMMQAPEPQWKWSGEQDTGVGDGVWGVTRPTPRERGTHTQTQRTHINSHTHEPTDTNTQLGLEDAVRCHSPLEVWRGGRPVCGTYAVRFLRPVSTVVLSVTLPPGGHAAAVSALVLVVPRTARHVCGQT